MRRADYQPFDKDAYLKDTSVQGNYTIDGALFGGQVKVEKLVVTRQKSPVITGRIGLNRFDLGPLGKLIVSEDQPEVDAGNALQSPALGGELTGDLEIDRIATDDIAHAKGRFTPRTMRVSRGTQTLSLRTSPSSAPGAPLGPPIVISLADDALQIPPVTFDPRPPTASRERSRSRAR